MSTPEEIKDQNILSEPHLLEPMLNSEGRVSRPWATWFRDLYNRVGQVGTNAIDLILELIYDITSIISDINSLITDIVDLVFANSDDIDQNKLDIQDLQDNKVHTGYGAIGLNAVTSLSDITSGNWQTLDFDTSILSTPKDISYNLTNNSMALNNSGIWSSSVKISILFDPLNAGRKLYLRFYNITKGTAGANVFVEGVGRNVDVGGFSFSFPADTPLPEEGDEVVLQISGDSTFTNVSQIGSVWQLIHVSEEK